MLTRDALIALITAIKKTATDPFVLALCEDNEDRLKAAKVYGFDKKSYMRKYMRTYMPKYLARKKAAAKA